MKSTYNTLIIAFALLSVGCATTMPPPNFAPANIGILQKKAPADLRTISIVTAQPNEQIGKKVNLGLQAARIPSWGNIPQHWKSALENALLRANAFDQGSPKKVAVLVKILEYWQPSFSTEFPTTVTAQYDIMDTSNGSIIFTTTITTVGKTQMGHSLLGVTRSFESQNRGVQMNIVQFIQQLEGASLDKPIFPGRKNPDSK